MRRASVFGLIVLAACVTRVTAATVAFPARTDWRSCIAGRLGTLGYTVDEDSVGVQAQRAGIRLRAYAGDSGIVRLERSAATDRADTDSVIITCAALPPISGSPSDRGS